MPWIVFARDYTEQFDDFTEQLDRIERAIKQMSEMEARLNEAISGVQSTVARVVDLVNQVIAKLAEQAPEVNLDDETAALEGLKADLQTAADNMSGALEPDAEPTGEDTQPV